MHILSVNTGSSSVKFTLFNMQDESVQIDGTFDGIGQPAGDVIYRQFNNSGEFVQHREVMKSASHERVLRQLFALVDDFLRDRQACLGAVGHRIVHGGEEHRSPVLVDESVKAAIQRASLLAPLHNAAGLQGIDGAEKYFPGVAQVAVFDTAFFMSLPEVAYRYALPKKLYEELHIRRYGFHGISHGFVAQQAADFLRKPLAQLKMISLHLGHGASAAAISGGECIDTSMGMTPLEGLVMGTRCGDIDPAIPGYLTRQASMNAGAIDALFNQESGLVGLCGESDLRVVQASARRGEQDALLAWDIFVYRVVKYVGAYFMALGGLDVLVFTAGAGENSPALRRSICDGLSPLAVALDDGANERNERRISSENSQVEVLVIPTDEALEIARQAQAVLVNGE